MHPAIELILARMESNPEEFVTEYTSKPLPYQNRWSAILNMIAEFAQKDEWKEVLAKWNEIRMNCVHREIMQELCVPTEQPEQKRLFEGKWVSASVVSTSPELYEKLKKVSSRSV